MCGVAGIYAYHSASNPVDRQELIRIRDHMASRDPYGIKPLYYADNGRTFKFASSVKALLAGGRISKVPDPAGVVGFYLLGSVPEPFTTYRDIRSLPAGSWMTVNGAGIREPAKY